MSPELMAIADESDNFLEALIAMFLVAVIDMIFGAMNVVLDEIT